MSGHSKWSQIKHKKALTDAKRGKIFSKMAREIFVAAKTGGATPDMNPRLRTAIERARAAGLPKDNIERAVQKAAGGDAGQDLQEVLYEALGPGGVSIIIEGITDNKNRTLNEVKLLLQNNGGKLAEAGSLAWNFEKIGTLEIALEDNPSLSREKIEEAIIESGASDFSFENNTWLVETIFPEVDKVRHILINLGIVIKEAGHDYKAKATVAMDKDVEAKLEKLLELLDDNDDVQGIYTNLATLA